VTSVYKEGSLSLGADKLTTIWKIILPVAMPGIVSAIILSVGRVVGETAVVYYTAGMVSRIPNSVMDSGRTLAVHLYILAKEGISFDKAYATGTILIILVLIINFSANFIIEKWSKN
jgi:phosphate transport system permease protein